MMLLLPSWKISKSSPLPKIAFALSLKNAVLPNPTVAPAPILILAAKSTVPLTSSAPANVEPPETFTSSASTRPVTSIP
jgi:hypothetical protein